MVMNVSQYIWESIDYGASQVAYNGKQLGLRPLEKHNGGVFRIWDKDFCKDWIAKHKQQMIDTYEQRMIDWWLGAENKGSHNQPSVDRIMNSTCA